MFNFANIIDKNNILKNFIFLTFVLIIFFLFYFFYYNKIKTINYEIIGKYPNNEYFYNTLVYSSFDLHSNELLQSMLNDNKFFIINKKYAYQDIYVKLMNNLVNDKFLTEFFNENKNLINKNNLFKINDYKSFLLKLKVEGYFKNRFENTNIFYSSTDTDQANSILDKLIKKSFNSAMSNEQDKYKKIFNIQNNFILEKILSIKVLFKYFDEIKKNENECFLNISTIQCYDKFKSFTTTQINKWNNENQLTTKGKIDLTNIGKLTLVDTNKEILYIRENISLLKKFVKETYFETSKQISINISEEILNSKYYNSTSKELQDIIKWRKSDINFAIKDILIAFDLLNKMKFYKEKGDYNLDRKEDFDLLEKNFNTHSLSDYNFFYEYLSNLNIMLNRLEQFYNTNLNEIKKVESGFLQTIFRYDELVKPNVIVKNKYTIYKSLFYSLVISIFFIAICNFIIQVYGSLTHNINNKLK